VTTRALEHPGTNHVTVTSATIHGFSVAFWWAAGFFGVGALVSFLLLESGNPVASGELAPAT